MSSPSSPAGNGGVMRRITKALVDGRMREAQARVAQHLLTFDDETLKALGKDRATLQRSRHDYYRF